MSDERETTAADLPGAPVEEQAASDTAVQAAVDRAAAEATVPPAVENDSKPDSEESDLGDSEAVPAATILADELPSAAAEPMVAETVVVETPAHDGEIRISPDHPMAALYMQSPMPPDLKGNRGAGVLIALLGTVAFAVLYAGIIALWLAPKFPPSTFLGEGLIPWITSWGFIAAVAAFFVGLAILVLVFGRAGWWAYVLFSLFVGVAVWGAASGTFALLGTPAESVKDLGGGTGFAGLFDRTRAVGFGLPTLGAAILAREVTVWFGAWIGRRGRRVTAKNAELLAEYETALAEVRAQQ